MSFSPLVLRRPTGKITAAAVLSAIVRLRSIGAVNFQISGCLYLSMPVIAANIPPLGAKMYTDPMPEPDECRAHAGQQRGQKVKTICRLLLCVYRIALFCMSFK